MSVDPPFPTVRRAILRRCSRTAHAARRAAIGSALKSRAHPDDKAWVRSPMARMIAWGWLTAAWADRRRAGSRDVRDAAEDGAARE